MRIAQLKLSDEKPVTVQDVKPSRQGRSTSMMGKSLTTLDFIGLVALTMSPLGLFLGTLIEYDNQRDTNT